MASKKRSSKKSSSTRRKVGYAAGALGVAGLAAGGAKAARFVKGARAMGHSGGIGTILKEGYRAHKWNRAGKARPVRDALKAVWANRGGKGGIRRDAAMTKRRRRMWELAGSAASSGKSYKVS